MQQQFDSYVVLDPLHVNGELTLGEDIADLWWAQDRVRGDGAFDIGKTAIADPHAPSHWRVNGPISNMREFAKAFGCKAGEIMVRADSLRPQIW